MSKSSYKDYRIGWLSLSTIGLLKRHRGRIRVTDDQS